MVVGRTLQLSCESGRVQAIRLSAQAGQVPQGLLAVETLGHLLTAHSYRPADSGWRLSEGVEQATGHARCN